jgi:hypothetical protein
VRTAFPGGTVSNFRCARSSNAGTWSCALVVNGTQSADITCTMPPGVNQCVDTVGVTSVAVPPAAELSVFADAGTGAGNTRFSFSFLHSPSP